MCFERSEVTTRRLSQVIRTAQLSAFEHSQLHIALFPEATFDLRELAGFAVRAYYASQGGRRVGDERAKLSSLRCTMLHSLTNYQEVVLILVDEDIPGTRAIGLGG